MSACRMRGVIVPEDAHLLWLRFQLAGWIDLSLRRKVPITLLILSRAMTGSAAMPSEESLRETLASMDMEDMGEVELMLLRAEQITHTDAKKVTQADKAREAAAKLQVLEHEIERVEEEEEEEDQARAEINAAKIDEMASEWTEDAAADGDVTVVSSSALRHICDRLMEDKQSGSFVVELANVLHELTDGMNGAATVTSGATDSTQSAVKGDKTAAVLSARVDRMLSSVEDQDAGKLRIDEDGDGKLSVKEFVAAIRHVGVKVPQPLLEDLVRHAAVGKFIVIQRVRDIADVLSTYDHDEDAPTS